MRHIQSLQLNIIIHSFSLMTKHWSLVTANLLNLSNFQIGFNLIFPWIIWWSRELSFNSNKCCPLIGLVWKNSNRKRMTQTPTRLHWIIKIKLMMEIPNNLQALQTFNQVKSLRHMIKSIKSSNQTRVIVKERSQLVNALLSFHAKAVIWANGYSSRRSGVGQKLRRCLPKLQSF